MARDLAGKAFKAPDNKLPDNLKDLDYDRYRAIRFLPERALWRGEKLPFEAQFFHRGFFYTNRVDIYEVKDGQGGQIAYQPELFSFGDLAPPGPGSISALPAFGSMRPSTSPTIMTRFASFSARAISGLSPRANCTAFRRAGLRSTPAKPRAKSFRRSRRSGSRSRQPTPTPLSCTPCSTARARPAAYRFTIRPGDTTVFDVEMAIYPASRSGACRPRADDQHVLLRTERPQGRRRLPARRFMIPTGWRCSTAAARSFGGRCTIPQIFRSAHSLTSIRAASG